MKLFALSLVIIGIISSPAQAGPTLDATNDFLPTYTGPLGRDLDVRSTEVFLQNNVFNFTATFGDAIGTTSGAFYVFGLDRGAGTARFAGGPLPVASNVLFDSVVVINNNNTGFVRDLISGTTTSLLTSAISYNGSVLSAFVDASSLPSRGFAAADYTVNLWPRVAGTTNAAIADFAPNNSNFAVTSIAAVPEPATWGMMILGFGLVGAAMRKSRQPLIDVRTRSLV